MPLGPPTTPNPAPALVSPRSPKTTTPSPTVPPPPANQAAPTDHFPRLIRVSSVSGTAAQRWSRGFIFGLLLPAEPQTPNPKPVGWVVPTIPVQSFPQENVDPPPPPATIHSC